MNITSGLLKRFVEAALEREEKKIEDELSELRKKDENLRKSIEKEDDKLISKYAKFEDNGNIRFSIKDIAEEETN